MSKQSKHSKQNKYDLWHDLAEQVYMEFIFECMSCGEIMVGEDEAIEILEKKIKEFARERIVQIFFIAGSEE